MYRQVEMVQGTSHQVAWIPAHGAKVGASVELKDGSGIWKVASVGSSAQDSEMQTLRDAYRYQREASDI